MAESTDFRKDLEIRVQGELGLPSNAAAKRAVDAVLNGVANILADNITASGFSFRTPLGVFKASSVAAKTARNPKTGEKVAVPAKHKITLKVSKTILDAGK